MAMKNVKVNSDVELKDRLVAIHSQPSLLSVTATALSAGVWVRLVKLPPPLPRV